MPEFKKNKTHNRSNEPVECQACHKMIEPGKPIVNHHISYFPEKIIKVHGRCHGLIHKARSDYPDLKPNPAQVIRWYKKKGVIFRESDLYAHDYYWLSWIDCVENGFWTEERKRKNALEIGMKYWDECARIQKVRDRLNIKVDWIASDILSQQ